MTRHRVGLNGSEKNLHTPTEALDSLRSALRLGPRPRAESPATRRLIGVLLCSERTLHHLVHWDGSWLRGCPLDAREPVDTLWTLGETPGTRARRIPSSSHLTHSKSLFDSASLPERRSRSEHNPLTMNKVDRVRTVTRQHEVASRS